MSLPFLEQFIRRDMAAAWAVAAAAALLPQGPPLKGGHLNVESAAADAEKLLHSPPPTAEEAVLLACAPAADEAYLEKRTNVLGKISSSELLDRDAEAGFWPAHLSANDRTAMEFIFVDEHVARRSTPPLRPLAASLCRPFANRCRVRLGRLSCTGCAWCPHVARSTFTMDGSWGKARAFQQGEDGWDAVDEAIDVCPASCIHLVTQAELRILEEHRQLHLESMQAEAGRYGEGHGHWRDPLTSDGWRRTRNCRSS
jgi:ferredoxin